MSLLGRVRKAEGLERKDVALDVVVFRIDAGP